MMPDDPGSPFQKARPQRGRGRRRLEIEVTAQGERPRAAVDLAAWLVRVAPTRVTGLVTVALVSDARIRVLNRRYRSQDCVTDVLSFPMNGDFQPPGCTPAGLRRAVPGSAGKRPAPEARFLGDIVIAVGRARRQARAARHSLATELRLLALHGLLHLAGYDHERDDGRMARVEAALRRKGRLGAGLIERAGRGSGGGAR